MNAWTDVLEGVFRLNTELTTTEEELVRELSSHHLPQPLTYTGSPVPTCEKEQCQGFRDQEKGSGTYFVTTPTLYLNILILSTSLGS